MLARLLVLLQYLLPRYWLTSLTYRLARIRHQTTKNFLITRFVRLYRVDTSEVRLEVPNGFASFNDFFVRELKANARPIDKRVDAIVSPVDGTVSQAGRLRGSSLLQAKGLAYSLDELLATDLDDARHFEDGSFATLYLAPFNYHRVHAPVTGELVAVRYVPGDLFSVNTATAAQIEGLFRRNERLTLRFTTQYGPVAVIFVGALNVGSISTPWSGELRPRKRGVPESIDIGTTTVTVAKGQLCGWFNMGSTVIVLMPVDVCCWGDELSPGASVRMGQTIGWLSAS